MITAYYSECNHQNDSPKNSIFAIRSNRPFDTGLNSLHCKLCKNEERTPCIFGHFHSVAFKLSSIVDFEFSFEPLDLETLMTEFSQI